MREVKERDVANGKHKTVSKETRQMSKGERKKRKKGQELQEADDKMRKLGKGTRGGLKKRTVQGSVVYADRRQAERERKRRQAEHKLCCIDKYGQEGLPQHFRRCIDCPGPVLVLKEGTDDSGGVDSG